jgi:hypothetical protein
MEIGVSIPPGSPGICGRTTPRFLAPGRRWETNAERGSEFFWAIMTLGLAGLRCMADRAFTQRAALAA